MAIWICRTLNRYKAAVGTENWVPWEKTNSTLETIRMLKDQEVQIIATEQAKNSISFKDLKPQFPAAIIIGNETYGISNEILNEADIVVDIPNVRYQSFF